jgi:hypothetical protein
LIIHEFVVPIETAAQIIGALCDTTVLLRHRAGNAQAGELFGALLAGFSVEDGTLVFACFECEEAEGVPQDPQARRRRGYTGTTCHSHQSSVTVSSSAPPWRVPRTLIAVLAALHASDRHCTTPRLCFGVSRREGAAGDRRYCACRNFPAELFLLTRLA